MRIFLALTLGYILSIFYRSFLSVIAEPLRADLGLTASDLGALSAAWFVAFALMQFPVGWALDQVGPRRTVAACMALGTVGAVLFALAPSAALATVAMALIGVGCAPVFMAALYLLARNTETSRFAGLASLFIGLGSLGNLIGAAPLARAADAFGWRSAMLAVAGLFAAAALLAAVLVHDPPRDAAAAIGTRRDDGVWSGLSAILRLRPLWLLAPLVLTAYACLVTTRGLWIAPYLGEVNGLGRQAQGDAAFAMALAMVAGAFAIGWLERHLGCAKRAVVATTAALIAAYGALAAFGARDGLVATALFVAIGFAGFNYAVLMAHARLFFPPHLTGRGMTSVNFLFIAGAAAVQYASGAWVDLARASALPPSATYAAMHAAFALLLAAALAIYVRSPSGSNPTEPR
jgi:sugar phosphate permease